MKSKSPFRFAVLLLLAATSIALAEDTKTKITGAGEQIGTASTQKLGFLGATPVARRANTKTARQVLEDFGLVATGGSDTANADALSKVANDTITDGVNYAVGTSTGSKIGTATTQKLGFYNATPVVQPAQTLTTRAALQNSGLLAADSANTATASGTGSTSTVTLSKTFGTITADAITTAAAATHVMTVTNTLVTATSVIVASVNQNGSTGLPVITSIEPGSGSFIIRLTNVHTSAAFNAAPIINFAVIK